MTDVARAMPETYLTNSCISIHLYKHECTLHMHEDVAHQRFHHNSARLKLGTMYVYKATLGAGSAPKMDPTI